MIKINVKNRMFSEYNWVTSTIGKTNTKAFPDLLHATEDCVWTTSSLRTVLHKLKGKQDLLPCGSFEIVKRSKSGLWLNPVESTESARLVSPMYGELDQSYSRLSLVGDVHWVDYCYIIKTDPGVSKAYNTDMFKLSHQMPGIRLTAWISPRPGLPLVLRNEGCCEAIIAAYSL